MTTTRISFLTASSRALNTPFSSLSGKFPDPYAERMTALQLGTASICAERRVPVIPGCMAHERTEGSVMSLTRRGGRAAERGMRLGENADISWGHARRRGRRTDFDVEIDEWWDARRFEGCEKIRRDFGRASMISRVVERRASRAARWRVIDRKSVSLVGRGYTQGEREDPPTSPQHLMMEHHAHPSIRQHPRYKQRIQKIRPPIRPRLAQRYLCSRDHYRFPRVGKEKRKDGRGVRERVGAGKHDEPFVAVPIVFDQFGNGVVVCSQPSPLTVQCVKYPQPPRAKEDHRFAVSNADSPPGVISDESICLSKSNISYPTLLPSESMTGVLSRGYRVFRPTCTVSTSDAKSRVASDSKGCCLIRRKKVSVRSCGVQHHALRLEDQLTGVRPFGVGSEAMVPPVPITSMFRSVMMSFVSLSLALYRSPCDYKLCTGRERIDNFSREKATLMIPNFSFSTCGAPHSPYSMIVCHGMCSTSTTESSSDRRTLAVLRSTLLLGRIFSLLTPLLLNDRRRDGLGYRYRLDKLGELFENRQGFEGKFGLAHLTHR